MKHVKCVSMPKPAIDDVLGVFSKVPVCFTNFISQILAAKAELASCIFTPAS